MKVKPAFTLVEIIVVVVIIAMVASIAVVSFNSQQKQSRDSLAAASLLNLANAMDDYYDNNGNYPITCDVSASAQLACANLNATYAGMTTPPTITSATDVATLKQKLPHLSDDIKHPTNNSSRIINQKVGSAVSTKSYFLLSMDLVSGGSLIFPVVLQNPQGGSISCNFRLTGQDSTGSAGLRPHQYALGYYSQAADSWKIYISAAQSHNNILNWNTSSSSNCQAEDISQLKTV